MRIVRLVVLGRVEATVNELPVHIDRAQRRALLAYLLLRANHTVTADQIIDALWGTTAPATAKAQVFAAVSAIRRAFRAAGRDPFAHTRGGYHLAATADELDLLAFHDQLDRAQRHAGRHNLEPAVSALREALALFRGKPLTGITGSFVESAQAGIDEQRLEAQQTLFELELAMGNHRGVMAELSDAAAENPFREHLIGQQMIALYRCGRQADALAVYRRTRQFLLDELAIDPTDELTTLHKRILDSDATLLAPATVRVHASGTDRRFLPREIPDFTGRHADLAQLDALATSASGGTDVVIITAVVGIGGVGKTALALHWAHRVAPRFPDGQLYLNLRGYDDRRPLRTSEALASLLHELGVPSERIPSDPDDAAALYRARLADQRVLIVLDNAGTAEQVRPLLPASPHAMVVITSRDALGGLVARDGARRHRLDVLPPGEAVDLLARILGADRVAADPPATDALVSACGRLPLALRIAAANLSAQPGLSLTSYLSDVVKDRGLDSLSVDGDAQSDMRAIFHQSYRCLTRSQQRAFAMLALVPGPDFPVAAAAALIDESVALTDEIIRRLIDAHLVLEHQSGRFTMHDLVREYARACADAPGRHDERAGAVRRLMTWAVGHAEAAVLHQYPASVRLPDTAETSEFAAAAQAKAWLEAEVANLVAIVETGAALGCPDAAWRIAFACRLFFNARVDRTGMLAIGEASRAAAALTGDPRAQAAAELVMAQAYTANGYDDRCLPHALRCLELARTTGWRELEIDAHNAASVHHFLSGNLRGSAEHARHAFDLSMTRGVAPPQYLGKLGLITMLMGSLATASDYLEQTLHSENHRVGYSRAITLLNLAEVRALQGRRVEAEQLLLQAIRRLEEAGNSHVRALAQVAMATVRHEGGDRHEAWNLLAEARRVLEDSADALALAQLSYARGRLMIADDRHDEAIEVLEPALDLARGRGNRHPATQIMIALASAYADRDHDKALGLAVQALDAAKEGQFRLLEGQAWQVASAIHLSAGRLDPAREAASAALRIHGETGHEPGQREAARLLDTIGEPAASAPR